MVSLPIMAVRPNDFGQPANGFSTQDHSVTAMGSGITYNFKIHYTTAVTVPANPHKTTISFINSVKATLTNTVNTLLSPTYSADGIPFQAPLQDGILGGDNKYDVYVLDLTTAFSMD